MCTYKCVFLRSSLNTQKPCCHVSITGQIFESQPSRGSSQNLFSSPKAYFQGFLVLDLSSISVLQFISCAPGWIQHWNQVFGLNGCTLQWIFTRKQLLTLLWTLLLFDLWCTATTLTGLPLLTVIMRRSIQKHTRVTTNCDHVDIFPSSRVDNSFAYDWLSATSWVTKHYLLFILSSIMKNAAFISAWGKKKKLFYLIPWLTHFTASSLPLFVSSFYLISSPQARWQCH